MSTILVSGSTGFIGTAICENLKQKGFQIVRLVRKPSNPNDVLWNPKKKQIEREKLKNIDIAIFLSGEPIVGFWTRRKKKKIYSSRIESSRFLIQTLEEASPNLRLYVSASAVGFYGDCRDQKITESHKRGEGFLSKVCSDWEKEVLESKFPRKVLLRFGMILEKDGGALKKLLPSYRLGFGGKFGNGKQMLSWIAMQDVVEIVRFCIENKSIQGPVNIVSPEPITQEEFGKSLAKALRRPFWFHIPKTILRLLLGQMADEVFLFSCGATAEKLLSAGYKFKYPKLEPFFKDRLTR